MVDNVADHVHRNVFWVPPELFPVPQEADMVFNPEDPLREGPGGRGECPGDKPEVLCPPRLVDIAAVAHVYVSAEYFEKTLARELYYVGLVERLDPFLKSQWEPLSTIPWLNFVCHDLFHDLVLWLFTFSCDRSSGLGTSILVFLLCVRAPKILIRLPRHTTDLDSKD
ncbi:uncharacterized protein LOC143020499 [Oratosquilla oratoria]|uniref:uncharacterized protein LOC143020499 n=1 Tax=Oratosquilla oratoria TaxID=337810 RepID=UPI003F75F523